MNREEFKEKTYEDSHGYYRWKDTGRLVHRTIAYKEIYLKNRKKYKFRFGEYQVDHKDGDKKNNRIENLEIVPIRDHEFKHKILRYEYPFIYTCIIFIILIFTWYGYLGWASGYKYNLRDIIFMFSTAIAAGVLIYLVNKKHKGYKYV